MKSEKDRGWAAFAFCFVLVCSLLVLAFYVLVPRFDHGNAKKKTAISEISFLWTALDNFNVDCGRFPTTAEGLQPLMVQPAGTYGWKGPYLEHGVPCDPWGNAYEYKCPGDHNKKTFDLYSFGHDGREGGGDDLDNWNKR